MNQPQVYISFRMDWLDLLAVQGTLKSLLQHHSSKIPILRLSAFFIVLLSHPYMTTGKAIALTRWTFVGYICVFVGYKVSIYSIISSYLLCHRLGNHRCVGLSLDFLSCLIAYISVFVPVSYYFYDCSFVVYCEVQEPDSSSTAFLSQDYCSYSWSFVFPYKL